MKIKIFISKRKPSDDFLEDLAASLRKRGNVEILSQDSMNGQDINAEQEAYARQADVAVFLFSLDSCAPRHGEPEPVTDDPYARLLAGSFSEESYQVAEAEAVRARMQPPLRPPVVLSILLDHTPRPNSPKPDWVPPLDLEKLRGELLKRPATDWLVDYTIEEISPGAHGETKRTDAVLAVSSLIFNCVANQKEKEARRKEEEREAKRKAALATDEELKYLRRSAELWVNGWLHQSSQGGKDDQFGFRPALFLELNVRRMTGDRAVLSLDETLFQRGRSPVVLTGEAGSGKTTTVATTALAMSADWGGSMARQARRVARTRPPGQRGSHLFPVVVRASRMVALARERGLFMADSRMIYDAIGRALLGETVPPDEAIAYAEERTGVLSYAVFIDGLDEVDNFKDERNVRLAAASLHADLNEGMVILTRRSGEGIDADFEWLELLQPSPRQARSYVVRASGGDHEAARFAARKALALMREPDGRDILNKPLSLSAFMGLIQEREVVEKPSDLVPHTIQFQLREEVTGYGPEKLEPVLGALAMAISCSQGDRVSREAALKCVAQAAPAQGLASDDRTAKAVLGAILKGGLLIEDKTSPVYAMSFRIATYREVMAGRHLAALFTAEDARLPQDAQPRRLGAVVRRAIRDGLRGPPLHRMLRACLDKARSGDVTEPEFRSDWLTHTARALSDINGAERAGTPELAQLALDVEAAFAAESPSWSPPLRDRVLEALFGLAGQDDPAAHAAAIGAMRARILPNWTPWVRWPHPTDDGGELWLGAAPVDAASFAAFLQDHEPRAPSPAPAGGASSKDDRWGPASRPDAPVVGVTWDEAVRYARHATEEARRSGDIGADEILRLPTLGEWRSIMAALSGDGSYPWGSDHDGPEIVNRFSVPPDRPSSCGAFESYGLESLYDFGSNVRCWLIPDRDGEAVWPPRLRDDEDPRGGGGSWMRPLRYCHFRDSSEPRRRNTRENDLGLRLVRVRGDRAAYDSRRI